MGWGKKTKKVSQKIIDFKVFLEEWIESMSDLVLAPMPLRTVCLSNEFFMFVELGYIWVEGGFASKVQVEVHTGVSPSFP